MALREGKQQILPFKNGGRYFIYIAGARFISLIMNCSFSVTSIISYFIFSHVVSFPFDLALLLLPVVLHEENK